MKKNLLFPIGIVVVITGLVLFFIVQRIFKADEFGKSYKKDVIVNTTTEKGTQQTEKDLPLPEEDTNNEIQPERFIVTELIRIPWGDGKAEAGLDDPLVRGIIDGGPTVGPKSFDVDEDGNVYILDTVNGRVLRYNPKGEYVGSIAVADVTPDDIGVRNGQIYIFDRGSEKVWKYNLSGENIEIYTLPHASTFGGIYFDYLKNPLMRCDDISDVVYYYQIEQNNRLIIKTDSAPSQYENVLLSAEGISEGHIDVMDTLGNKVREIKINLPPLTAVEDKYFPLLGNDANRNTYILYFYQTEETHEWDSDLWKFDQQGNLLSSFNIGSIGELKDRQDTFPFVDYRLSSQGDVYYMYHSKDFFRIFKFTSIKE